MKRLFLSLCLLAAMPLAAAAQLRIVTTTTDFADIARQVGGDKVVVHSVMKGPESLHNLMAKPTEMLQLNKADLFVHSGLDAEPWRDNLLKGARNPKVMPGKPGNVDMSAGIALLDVPTDKIDRAQGDVHAFGDPHYSLSPANVPIMTATLARALADLDPANAGIYRDNAVRFVNEMADLHKELRERLAPYPGLKVITFHRAWNYLAQAFDLNIVATIEPKPLITPTPAELRQVIETAKQNDVRIVIVETYNSYDQAKYVADAVGARLLVLPDHVNGVADVETYPKLFRHNVQALIDAAQAAGVAAKE